MYVCMYVCDVFIFIYCLCILFITSSRRHLGGVYSSGISVMSNVMSASGWPSFSLLKNSLPPEVVLKHSCGQYSSFFSFSFLLKMSEMHI